ncbi:unnamed protein product [Rangifer tarandus platyrhynchus]|uniref:Uncharacterized protein n=1 Tax=Rangifer tarandus platyrhynchus TaxID=3082113 RepID=A0AC59Y8U9_RANTA
MSVERPQVAELRGRDPESVTTPPPHQLSPHWLTLLSRGPRPACVHPEVLATLAPPKQQPLTCQWVFASRPGLGGCRSGGTGPHVGGWPRNSSDQSAGSLLRSPLSGQEPWDPRTLGKARQPWGEGPRASNMVSFGACQLDKVRPHWQGRGVV